MVYSTDAAKWRAYQFLDPFAAGCFYVCNKINKYFCRPDCDAHPMTELRLEIKFVSSVLEAVELGYVPCDSCDPILAPPVDVDLLIKTVREVNSSIGFAPPPMDDDDERPNKKIGESSIENSHPQRRQLVPAISYNNKYPNFDRDTHASVSKNDNEHYKLVQLACRHLALAAALSIFAVPSVSNSPKLEESSPDPYPGKKSRKRRGGVLGFKELAAKSKLSAWHFHRVFKSVTGLTPKTYGDKCYEYLQSKRDEARDLGTAITNSAKSSDSVHSLISMDNLNKTYSSPALSVGSVILPVTGHKRLRNDDNDCPLPKRLMPVSTPSITPYVDFAGYEEESCSGFDFDSRATSAPDLASFNFRPQSLFSHSKPIDFSADVPFSSLDTMPLQFSFPLLEIVPMANLQNLMEPVAFEEPLNNFGGAGFSADMFAATGEDIPPMQHELDIADSLSFGLLPELLTSNVGL